MATSTGLLITLPQIVDLALGSPEVGAVNFNLLNATLQVIIQQLNLSEYVIDYRGPEADRIQGLLATAKPGVSLKITETGGTDGISQVATKQEVQIGKVEPRRNSKEEPSAGALKPGKIICVEPQNDRKNLNVPHVVVGVSQELFIQINQDVEDLKSRVNDLMEIPESETVMEALRSQGKDKVTPVIDMWHALSISKRVDAAESGVAKLADMFENLVRDIASFGTKVEATSSKAEKTSAKMPEVEQKADLPDVPSVDQTSTAAVSRASDESGKRAGSEGGHERRQSIFAEISNRLELIEQRIQGLEAGGGGTRKPDEETSEVAGGQDIEIDGDLATELERLKTKINNLEHEYGNFIKGFKNKALSDIFKEFDEINRKLIEIQENEAAEVNNTAENETNELIEKLEQLKTQINKIEQTLTAQVRKIQQQQMAYEKELGGLLESQNTRAEQVTDTASLSDLYNRIMKIQDDIESLNKITERISEEIEERTLTIESLMEQIALLKTTKADREDLEEALADKADAVQVNRKVSTMQFESACEDLTKNIEETLVKVAQQEQMWQTTLDELHVTIGSKLDKMEFDPLRDFVNKKIKSLQTRLKALLAMKQEQEAAGAKNRLLKNVNCISCDKDVVMQKQNPFPTFPVPPSMPATRTIKPYIAYELDAVRKQQKIIPQARNMNYLENSKKEFKKEAVPLAVMQKVEKKPEKAVPLGHVCNRYCGGSHTVTMPHQRVAYIGHFLSQWGPQAIPLDETNVMGTDGQLYKGRGFPEGFSKEVQRVSAVMQTDEPPRRVERMSSTLEAIKRRSKIEKELEPVKEETASECTTEEVKDVKKDDSKTAQRRRSSKGEGLEGREGKSSKSQKPSVKKSSSKRLSSVKDTAPPQEETAEQPPPAESAEQPADENPPPAAEAEGEEAAPAAEAAPPAEE